MAQIYHFLNYKELLTFYCATFQLNYHFGGHICKNLQVFSVQKPQVLLKNLPLNLPVKKPVRTLVYISYLIMANYQTLMLSM